MTLLHGRRLVGSSLLAMFFVLCWIQASLLISSVKAHPTSKPYIPFRTDPFDQDHVHHQLEWTEDTTQSKVTYFDPAKAPPNDQCPLQFSLGRSARQHNNAQHQHLGIVSAPIIDPILPYQGPGRQVLYTTQYEHLDMLSPSKETSMGDIVKEGLRQHLGFPLLFESSSFLTSPIVLDINRDGILDAVLTDYDGGIYAIGLQLDKDGGRYFHKAQVPRLYVRRHWMECKVNETLGLEQVTDDDTPVEQKTEENVDDVPSDRGYDHDDIHDPYHSYFEYTYGNSAEHENIIRGVSGNPLELDQDHIKTLQERRSRKIQHKTEENGNPGDEIPDEEWSESVDSQGDGEDQSHTDETHRRLQEAVVDESSHELQNQEQHQEDQQQQHVEQNGDQVAEETNNRDSRETTPDRVAEETGGHVEQHEEHGEQPQHEQQQQGEQHHEEEQEQQGEAQQEEQQHQEQQNTQADESHSSEQSATTPQGGTNADETKPVQDGTDTDTNGEEVGSEPETQEDVSETGDGDGSTEEQTTDEIPESVDVMREEMEDTENFGNFYGDDYWGDMPPGGDDDGYYGDDMTAESEATEEYDYEGENYPRYDDEYPYYDDYYGRYNSAQNDYYDDKHYVRIHPHILCTPSIAEFPKLYNNKGETEHLMFVAVSYYMDEDEYEGFFSYKRFAETDHGDDSETQRGTFVASAIMIYQFGDSPRWGRQEHLDMSGDPTAPTNSTLVGSIPFREENAKMGAFALSSPTVADIDGDGSMEVLLGTSMGFVYVYDARNLYKKDNWPVQFQYGIESRILVEDVLGDTNLEILVADVGGNVVCLDHKGNKIWHRDLAASVDRTNAVVVGSSSMVLGDVNADGIMDIVVVMKMKTDRPAAHFLFALSADTGKDLENFPVRIWSVNKYARPNSHDDMVHEKVPAPLLVDLHADQSFFNSYLHRKGGKWTPPERKVPKKDPPHGGNAYGLHIVQPVGPHLIIMEAGSGCLQSMSIGDDILATVQADDVHGMNNLDLIVSTASGNIITLENPTPFHPLNVWSKGEMRGRTNNFAHGYSASQGIFIHEMSRQYRDIFGVFIPITFEIFDNRPNIQNEPDRQKYVVEIRESTSRPLFRAEYTQCGVYTERLYLTTGPGYYVMTILLKTTHGLVFEDTFHFGYNVNYMDGYGILLWLPLTIAACCILFCYNQPSNWEDDDFRPAGRQGLLG